VEAVGGFSPVLEQLICDKRVSTPPAITGNLLVKKIRKSITSTN
jgi:hypothetical protein